MRLGLLAMRRVLLEAEGSAGADTDTGVVADVGAEPR